MIVASLVLAATLSPTARVVARYEKQEAKQLLPMLGEVIRFPTYAGNDEAHAQQKAWLLKTAKDLGFTARDAGKITEIELAGPENAPVLGLVIHGDVQPVEDPESWTIPPFEGRVENGYVLGRGAADDKGPLIQALLAMKALKESGIKRTHTIRLLVGSEEESAAGEIAEYLKDHAPPDYSLVLDSEFPVVVGEKAWDGISIATKLTERGESQFPYEVVWMDAGISPSIVPERAEVKLRWKPGTRLDWTSIAENLQSTKMTGGTRIAVGVAPETAALLRVVAYGKAAHSGMNIEGGQNALVGLARALEGKLPKGGADDLLAFARMAGQDLHGTGLGIKDSDPVWGRFSVNVATLKPVKADPSKTALFINLRRIPPRTAKEMQAYLESVVRDFNARTGASLEVIHDESYFADEPLGFDPNARIVKRLMAAYSRATGVKNPKPAISGGGTYAKRLPSSIAFGMWFPGKPYPGHDIDEKIPVADLERGTRVLIHALVDLATGKKIEKPFEP